MGVRHLPLVILDPRLLKQRSVLDYELVDELQTGSALSLTPSPDLKDLVWDSEARLAISSDPDDDYYQPPLRRWVLAVWMLLVPLASIRNHTLSKSCLSWLLVQKRNSV